MPTCPNDNEHGEMIDNELAVDNTRSCTSCGYTESHEADTFRSWS